MFRAPSQSALHRLGLGVRQMVVPRGFPGSVSPGYEGYTGWLAVGLFAHSFTVMVSTNALLSGFFAEMSAASWLLKDLLPPLLAGTLASRIRTLEANPKKWLGAACFANSLLGMAEFLIPHLMPKDSWMLLAICTNVGKMSGYLIIGAARAVLQKTLATGDNLGEVTSKLGTLGMLMHCFGAAGALTLVQVLGFWGQLSALSAGAVVGFYAPVRASQCVVMPNLSAVSLRRLVQRFAAARASTTSSAATTTTASATTTTSATTTSATTTTAASSASAASSTSASASSASSASFTSATSTVASAGAVRWQCPSPEQLHHELQSRWSVRHSLWARASAWRELLGSDHAVVHVGAVSLLVGPALSCAQDVSALAHWRAAMDATGAPPPPAWTLGAGGQGRLLLLYGANATPAEVIEGFAVAWFAADAVATDLGGARAAAAASLERASVASLPTWRRAGAELREAMEAAGWQCTACSIDDVSRRVRWTGQWREEWPAGEDAHLRVRTAPRVQL